MTESILYVLFLVGVMGATINVMRLIRSRRDQ